MSSIVISATGLYTPENSVSNDELVIAFNAYVELYNSENAAAIEAGELVALQGSSAAFIEKASGIKQRYVMEKEGIIDPKVMCPQIPERGNDQPSLQCEMGVAAAKQAMEAAGKTAADIDAVFVACSNFQRPYPAIGIEIQGALGIDGFAVDMNMACSSATFGIQAAVDAVRSGHARAALVINPEICTGHLNFRDRDSHFIFGDACTAMLIEQKSTCTAEGAFEVLGTRLKTTFSNNIRNNFGFMNRTAPESVGLTDKLFVQKGRKVFKEVVPMVASLILEHLAAEDLQADDLRRMWLHQANANMNVLIGKKVLGRPATADEAPTILDEYANTSSAGSIIAFHKHNKDLLPGELGLICSFGAGYSIGSVIVRRLPS